MSPRIIRSGALAAFSAVVFLLIQVGIGAGMGNDFGLLSRTVDPVRMSSFFLAQAPALTYLMTADDAFAIAYGIAFIALGYSLITRTKILGIPALVLAVVTSLTDLSENSLTLAAVQTVTQRQALDANVLVLLFWLGQMKYLVIDIAVILIAIGVWDEGRTGKIFAVLLLLFPLFGILAISFEPLALVRALWMLVLLVAGGVFLWRIKGQVV